MPRVDSESLVRYARTDVLYSRSFDGVSDLSSVRRAARQALSVHGVPLGNIDAVVLVLSELVTNALWHARAPYVAAVKRNPRGITIVEVADCGDGDASVREPDESGGYGLHLVNQLTDVWGVHDDPALGGKIVWAALGDGRRL